MGALRITVNVPKYYKSQLSQIFLSPQITQILQIISDLTDEKAMQGFENLQLGEAKSVLFLQKSRRVGGKIRLIRDICG